MKVFKNLTATLILGVALTVNAYAGDQHTPGAIPPPPPPATSTTESDKYVPTPNDVESNIDLASEGADYFFDALILLLSVY